LGSTNTPPAAVDVVAAVEVVGLAEVGATEVVGAIDVVGLAEVVGVDDVVGADEVVITGVVELAVVEGVFVELVPPPPPHPAMLRIRSNKTDVNAIPFLNTPIPLLSYQH
jgi:hypothetical protein